MNKPRCWFLVLILSASGGAYSQEVNSLSNGPATAVADTTSLTAADSLSIFNLIDSLLNLGNLSPSQLAIRLAYNSNVLSAGRTLGIENFGLSPGVSFYHRTGLYGDISSYWSKDFEPSYYLTIISAGYMKDLSRRVSVMASYDRYFYRVDEDTYIPYSNTLSVTPIIDLKYISFSANYSFYFGQQNAHRIMPGASIIIEKRKFWKVDRIALMPSFFALWGNEVISEIDYVRPATFLEARQNFQKYGTVYKVVQTNKDVFGIMNYTISVPFNMTLGNWAVTFTYNYNIPRALPGETLTFSESTYLAASVAYFISMRRNKNTL